MGAWGPGIFENDDALDWVYGLGQARGPGPVSEALEAVVHDDGGYLDASDCAMALAAAEVVAASAGSPGPGLPEEAAAWVREHGATVESGASALAVRAARAVRDAPGSELRELWEESGEAGEWYAAVDGLVSRLGR
ncbi:DUF4259 domain-containing protein [Rubrobacter marinus]|uniref:DUF4259 domain-containing protein n=1 Tax=Rubrobacter marinus TaxID=2653852 RepID=A0A6G8PTG7_9ACTN|nr:DUF4259 domain-containing protein [Rubrobacter marinus]QIN77634.1 DUF4259 domain-containing protein [Rubrobacter marinus]